MKFTINTVFSAGKTLAEYSSFFYVFRLSARIFVQLCPARHFASVHIKARVYRDEKTNRTQIYFINNRVGVLLYSSVRALAISTCGEFRRKTLAPTHAHAHPHAQPHHDADDETN
jgi:hypothetical protein